MFYVFVLCLLFPSLQAFSISLRTHNNSTSLPAEQPFNLVVEVKEGDRNTGDVVLDGLNQLQLIGRQRSNSVTMINGNFSSTIVYYFTVVANNPGVITVGPAKVRHEGKEIASNTLRIAITQTPIPQSQGQPRAKGSETRAGMSTKLTTNKNEVVLGESIEALFTFCSSQPVMEASLAKFEAPGFTIKEVKHQQQRQEIINGVMHNIFEKKYILIPHKEGSFTLGPIVLEAVVPVRHQRRSGGIFDDDFFSSLFGGQAERVQLKTDPLAIQVKPIPTKQAIDGIGIFTSYKATISDDQAHPHEPLTFSLDLEGKGDLDHITIPKLKVPRNMKYYESKNETTENEHDAFASGRKHFEFVLQATTPGVFTIPAQEFVYFDTTAQQVKTLCSNPITVTIHGTASASDAVIQKDNKPAPIANTVDEAIEEPTAPPLQQPSSPPTALPWWIFGLVLFTPIPFFAKPLFGLLEKSWALLRTKKSRTKSHQKKVFKALIRQENIDGIYAFFITHIAQQKNSATLSLSMDDVETYLLQRGFEYDKIDEFISFLGSCSGSKYAHKSFSAQEKEALLSKAHYWFLTLL